MCDFFCQSMENGDLADIVRPGVRATLPAEVRSAVAAHSWQPFLSVPPPFGGPANDHFGDPFVNLRDPLLNQLTVAGVEFLTGAAVMAAPVLEVSDHEVKRSPCNVLSRVLQISPEGGTAKPPPPVIKRPAPLVTSTSTLDRGGGAQISSPGRITPGIKRRKSMAKKVVCIPAPATASNRPSSGEVVPSDLWAWRKYGQKPIKGSPYPRGYYRCSSSKGCSARKQVERSRTDPNMLVITYSSEHNHPWPTQRNALAGSTRTQPPTKTNTNSSSTISSKILPKETTCAATSSSLVKLEEEITDHDHQIERVLIDDQVISSEFDQDFHQSYKPMIPESSHPDDFFADLAELEPDPMSLIFAKGFNTTDHQKKPDHEKVLDPIFNMFDWVAGSSFGELANKKKGL